MLPEGGEDKLLPNPGEAAPNPVEAAPNPGEAALNPGEAVPNPGEAAPNPEEAAPNPEEADAPNPVEVPKRLELPGFYSNILIFSRNLC